MSNKPDNVTPIRKVLDDAEPVVLPAEVGEGPGDSGGQKWSLQASPVEPLGLSGEEYYYIDASGQFRMLRAREHSALNFIGLFGGHYRFLWRYFPRVNKEGEVTGWQAQRVAEEMMAACHLAGVWDAASRVRGTGAWLGGDGGLVLHCGDGVLIGGKWKPPGRHGEFVYPAAAPSPRPSARQAKAPGKKLIALLDCWSFKRNFIDVQLMLGWIGAAMIAGAIPWRPMVWLTGDTATGKSTLQKLIKHLFVAILSSSDATAAGIHQILANRTWPVALDELEAEASGKKQQNLIKLARQAASGGLVIRGGAEHSGTEFTVLSSFVFSSILVPPMRSQDRNRMAILELDKIPEDAVPPELKPDALGKLGRAILRRMVDGFPRFHKTLETYRQALAEVGHSGRGADQFGTLLAAADLIEHGEKGLKKRAETWAQKFRPEDLAERGEDASDHEACLEHLLTSPIDTFRAGIKRTVSYWIGKVQQGEQNTPDQLEAKEALAAMGLRVQHLEQQDWLFVANGHRALAHIFEGTHWASQPGAIGGWVQSLRRLDEARPSRQRIEGRLYHGTMVPMELVLPSSQLKKVREMSARRSAEPPADPLNSL